jgi:hypothetical protein
MAYLVGDRLEVSVFIADAEYPLDAVNLLNWMHIATSVRHSLPVIGFEITDVQHIFDRIGLLDGTPIRVVIKPYNGDGKTFVFRKFNHTRKFDGASYVWTIHGYWDAPLYWAASSIRAIEGTSQNVLKEIAQTCDLKFDGAATNDSMIWVPRNRTYRAWAKDIANHAWITDTSCMVLGVDLDGTMRLVDVNKKVDPEVKIVGYQFQKGSLTATDIQVSASSGLNNALTGYQNMRVAQSVTAENAHTVIKSLNWTPDVKTPHYNEDLKQKLGRGAVRFAPIDAGNLHLNYDKADYQNKRYRNLYSFGLDALMVTTTGIQLGQKVSLALQVEELAQDTPNSGAYTTTSRAIYVQGANYSEKIGLARQGTNEVMR